ncbi:MAG: DNA polymerase III subunit alpha, partial [Chloroflexi bacterium]|nr:DNA polymerase III subunit alpha [Chloroflexota bacterium]
EVHRELGIPIVATNDSHYATLDKADAQDILLCIQTNSVVNDPERMRMQPPVFYLKRPDEMWERFGHLPEALTNTVAIAERCDLSLEFGRLNFPALDHVVPAGQTPQAFLAQTCRERLGQRYGPRLRTEHRERLEYELRVVESTGFAAYILFVWDFVDWARRQGITCGPRGSAAGSIILYCLGVSDVDPVGFGLTFERFLNPERIQMPDIDMDFADDRRDEVIQYVVERYGRERVAQIITFGRLLARAAIRDVGRALDYPLGEVDRVAKLVPTIPIGLKLDQAIEQSPELKRLYESDPNVTRLLDTARSVEGVARHAGTHAAGVVVADQPLVEYVPLQRSSRGDSVMTQYHMKTLEKIGLLKMDFLGLANLTMLAKALENIRQRTGQQVDLGAIDVEDPTTYAMLSRGETRTVFQLEGAGMTRYIQELKPSTIDHLAAMVALYRPGPMAHIPSYIARREGREPAVPPDPSLEELLRESYGVIVYQDQVLQVVRKLAGYSLGQADVLRRAMGKKDRAVMAEEGPRFIATAVEHGYPRRTAEQLWDLLQPFAGYAFNKAHAYCYAFVAYQTAYLKANHPVEWFAAVLTTIAEDTEKVVGVVGECRRLGIEVLPPDINRSRLDFTVEPLGHAWGIRFGLGAIKNVGEGAVELIQAERDRDGDFRSLEDFCRRLDLHTVNKRVLESLTKAGALDVFGGRQALLASLDNALTAAQRDKQAAEAGQFGMFDAFGVDTAASPLAFAASVILSGGVEDKRQHALWEKEALGFNFADHPFREPALWLSQVLTHNTGHVTNELGGEKIKLGGIVTGVRRIVTRSRDQMCILTLEDLHGSVEAIVFPRTFDRFPDLWREELILVVDGKVDTRNDKPQLVVERAEAWQRPADGTPPPAPPPVDVDPAPLPPPRVGSNGRHTSAVPADGSPPGRGPSSDTLRNIVSVRVPRADDATCLRTLEQLHALVERWPGDARLELTLFDRDGVPVRLEGGDTAIGSNAEVQGQLQALVGSENVAVRLLESDERAHAQLVS